ncbi:transposase [Spirochaetia bacterium]|nr:transposase [Spirochaetia bacterium]
MDPLNDFLFFKIMGEKGDETQLLGFLNAILRRTEQDRLVSIEILENKTFSAEVIGNKTCILDVRAILGDGTGVNIEVQLRNLGNMDRRSLFYWSKAYTSSFSAGEDYIDLPNVIAINIVNFEFFEQSDFHTTFHLWEDNDKGLLLTSALEIHFIDMVKFRAFGAKDIKNEPLHRWLTWLNQDSPPELVKEVVEMDVAIQKAEELTRRVSSNREALHQYTLRQMALSDWTSGVNQAKRDNAKEIAKRLKEMGISPAQIAQGTSLSLEEITKL